MDKNKILIDWFAFTTSICSPFDIINLLGMSDCPFVETTGARGWRKRLYFNCISIHFDGHDGMVWLEMSGQGCRAFETLGHGDYNILFNFVLDNKSQCNVTRLDVAYDDFNGLLDLDCIVSDTLSHNFVSRTRDWDVNISSKGRCVTFGVHKSDVIIRIYDKAAERGRSDEIDHWVRAEIMLKHDRAFEFVRLLMPEYDYTIVNNFKAIKQKSVLIRPAEQIDKLYFLVLNNYLRFIRPVSTDTNKWRFPTAEHWISFCSSVTTDRVSLFVKPGVDYNVNKLSNVVTQMYGGAIYTYIHLFGINDLEDRVHICGAKLNPKYKMLLAENTAFLKAGVKLDT